MASASKFVLSKTNSGLFEDLGFDLSLSVFLSSLWGLGGSFNFGSFLDFLGCVARAPGVQF